MTQAFVFPGQGSQSVGMGKEIYDAFPVAREVFQEVDDSLGKNLTKIIFEGPESDLTNTVNAQPALMAVSIATLRVLLSESGKKIKDFASCVAGHSLGEYTALTAAGSLSLAQCATLLGVRGQAMQEAVPDNQGAMAAILGLEVDNVIEITKNMDAGQVCALANDNCPGQLVVSGHREAVAQAMTLATEAGCKRSVLLPVSGPFHSPLMAPAATKMQEALSTAEISQPVVPVVANVTAEFVDDPDTIRRLLVEQITSRVRWRESVAFMKSNGGVSHTTEIGAGKVLSGLTKRIDREITASVINTPADVETFLTERG
ncbi:MAG: ACP S-malonyltransferase [Alphaproteobacteria bacterium]